MIAGLSGSMTVAALIFQTWQKSHPASVFRCSVLIWDTTVKKKANKKNSSNPPSLNPPYTHIHACPFSARQWDGVCPCVVFSNKSGHVSWGMCVMCCGGHTGRFSALRAPINTKSERLCPKPLHHHHHHHPHQLPALPSAWENHIGMSLRDTAARINKLPPLQVCEEEIMEKGQGGCLCTQKAFVSFGGNKVCLCVCEHLCVFEPFLISEQWVHTVRGSNQYQLSSSTKGVKRSIPPQHDNSSSQAWLIQMSVWSTTGTFVRKRSKFG